MLAETGWTWKELQETPADVVNKLILFKHVRHIRENGGEMRFDDAQG